MNGRDPVLDRRSALLCSLIVAGSLLSASLTTPVSVSAVQVVSGKLTPGSTVIVTPRGRYDAGVFQRFFMGGLNRDLWSLPIEVEVLDLDDFAGGLTPLRRGGGLQTTSLRLRGADGQLWTFRSVDKDVTRSLDLSSGRAWRRASSRTRSPRSFR